jgi:hypothetical protein
MPDVPERRPTLQVDQVTEAEQAAAAELMTKLNTGSRPRDHELWHRLNGASENWRHMAPRHLSW